jgi:hypothetical protein
LDDRLRDGVLADIAHRLLLIWRFYCEVDFTLPLVAETGGYFGECRLWLIDVGRDFHRRYVAMLAEMAETEVNAVSSDKLRRCHETACRDRHSIPS